MRMFGAAANAAGLRWARRTNATDASNAPRAASRSPPPPERRPAASHRAPASAFTTAPPRSRGEEKRAEEKFDKFFLQNIFVGCERRPGGRVAGGG
jgi:hypothetical protein